MPCRSIFSSAERDDLIILPDNQEFYESTHIYPGVNYFRI